VRKRFSVVLVSCAAVVGMAFGPVSGAFAVSGNSPKTPGNSTHFNHNDTPCTTGNPDSCPGS
jgi:ABC-type oligopeptide transport system substrate-binding subunit